MATPHNRLRILFVDDEPNVVEILSHEVSRMGHEVYVCHDGRSALQYLQQMSFDLAVLDLKMPGMNGIDVLKQLKQLTPDTEAVMLTGYPDKETAVAAMRLGAMDYLNKPCSFADVEAVLLRVLEKRKLKNQNVALQTRVQNAEGPNLMIGNAPAMQPVMQVIRMVAPTDAAVLILGETGTGKDVVARKIVELSRRADQPFVPVNCGALSENLAESELFGHEKGAYTGADGPKRGLFEVADGGTLFLDELGELSKNIQVKLLRFLESGEIRPLGSTKPKRVNVRILAATNRDLQTMIAQGEFREDLYFRINTFEVRLPPLRERREDIPQLACVLLARYAKRPPEQAVQLLTPETLQWLLAYDWRGNVRQLANTMEYAFILAGGGRIEPQHLPREILNPTPRPQMYASVATQPQYAPTPPPLSPTAPGDQTRTLREIEMEYILQTLAKNGNDKKKTAAELGIALKTLYNRLNEWEAQRMAG